MARYGAGNQPNQPNLAIYTTAAAGTDWTTGTTPVTLFTVTGDVRIQLVGIVQGTAFTSTSNDGTLEIGTTEDINAIIASTIANGTQLAATDVWVDSTPSVDIEANSSNWFYVGGGADIIITIATNSMTAGIMNIYCYWFPLTSDGQVVAA